MPPRYYSVRETDSYTDAVLHTDRDCPAGPVRAAPPTVRGEWCPDCGPESDEEDSGEETENVEVPQDPPDIEAAIESGVCPWCPPSDRYEGEHVGQHASSAHPEKWAEYSE